MAITGSDARAVTAAHDSLLNTQFDSSIIGGVQSGPTTSGFLKFNAGSTLAGVTPEMAQNIARGIDMYHTRVYDILKKLQDVDSTAAFKGSGLTRELSTFVEGVKKVSLDFLNKLTEAENEIVTSVANAYATQDTDVSGQLNSDAAGVSSTTASTGPGVSSPSNAQ